MVSGSISLPSPGFFSPFPHGTSALSVAGRIQPWIVVDPDSGWVPRAPPYSGTASWRRIRSAYGAVTLSGPAVRPVLLRMRFLLSTGHPHAALQPRLKRFGLLRFRSPLLTESLLISFPGLLRWFTSPSVALPDYFIHPPQCTACAVRVTPFGHPGITGCVLLPPAFRSLPRPSSPSCSKASAMDLSFAWPYYRSPLSGPCGNMPVLSDLPITFCSFAFGYFLPSACQTSLPGQSPVRASTGD